MPQVHARESESLPMEWESDRLQTLRAAVLEEWATIAKGHLLESKSPA